MKQPSLLSMLILFLVLLPGCDKDNEMAGYKYHGVITGKDMALCACCGGWLITLDNKTYRFVNLPSNSSISLDKETFPLSVMLDWDGSVNTCDRITISRIAKH